MLSNNQQITEKNKKEIKICIETNENGDTTPNKQDSVKAVLRGRFTAIQAYLKNQDKHQLNNLTLHLKQLDKEEQKNPRVSRRGKNNHKNQSRNELKRNKGEASKNQQH